MATSFFSRYVDETVVHPDPVSEPEAFSEFVRDILASRDIDVYLPVGQQSVELASKDKPTLSQYASLPVTDYETFQIANNKAATLRLAERLGVPHPRTAYPDSVREASELAGDFEFPVVIKPRVSFGSHGIEFVESRDEFETAYKSAHTDYERPLIQERIPWQGSYGVMGACFLYNWDSEVRAEFTVDFLRSFPPSGGPSTFRVSTHREDLLQYGRRLLDGLDWQGVAMLEFALDRRDDTPKLMEINPRFWNSMHTAIDAGVDFPWLTYLHARGEDPPMTTDYTIGVRGRTLFEDVMHLLAVRDRNTFDEFFPLRDDNTYYHIFSRDDMGPALGRFLSMSVSALNPTLWKELVSS